MRIKLRFTTSPDWTSRIIRAITWAPFSHVEFEIDGNAEDVIWDRRGYLGALFTGGVQLRPLNYCKPIREAHASIVVPDSVGRKVLEFAFKQIDKPYDVSGILNMGIRRDRDWRAEDSWFCSELVAAAFDNAGYPLLHDGGYVDRVTPRDLWLSPLLTFTAETPPQLVR